MMDKTMFCEPNILIQPNLDKQSTQERKQNMKQIIFDNYHSFPTMLKSIKNTCKLFNLVLIQSIRLWRKPKLLE